MKKAVYFVFTTMVLVLVLASCTNDSSNEDQSLYEIIDPAADVDPGTIKKPGGGS